MGCLQSNGSKICFFYSILMIKLRRNVLESELKIIDDLKWKYYVDTLYIISFEWLCWLELIKKSLE